MRREPHADSCSNPGRDDLWTCPGCYRDIATSEGTYTCENCGNTVECTLEEQPVCRSDIAND